MRREREEGGKESGRENQGRELSWRGGVLVCSSR